MQIINVSTPNSGLGDKVRDAFGKVNANFQEVLDLIAASQGGDIPDNLQEILDDITGDITTIQTSLGNIQNAISSVQSNITTIQVTQATQSSLISSIQSTVATHSTSISNLQSSVTSNTNSITAILATQSTQNTNISALQATASANTSAITALQSGKLNKGANTEFELLANTSNLYSPTLFSRTGTPFRSSSLSWDETLKTFTVAGSSAIWSATDAVTDGNMGIKTLNSGTESFKIYDNFGNFFSTGTLTGNKKVTRVFTEFRLVNGVSYNATEYKAVECPASVTTPIKDVVIPLNSIVTVDVANIAVLNTDNKSLIGEAQFIFQNIGGTVSDISISSHKYRNQYSYINASASYVTSTDTRLDSSVSGATASINFVNTTNKVTAVHCEVKYNITVVPE